MLEALHPHSYSREHISSFDRSDVYTPHGSGLFMESYLSTPQKSSDLLPADYRIHFGISLSDAVLAIKLGMTAHVRIFDAMLRFGLGGFPVSAAEIAEELTRWGIPLSPAQAQRVLTDERLFRFVEERKTGKRGRQAKLYCMHDSETLCQKLGFVLGVVNYAPELMPVDFSTGLNYKHMMAGRVLAVRNEDSRLTQTKMWRVCRQTIIRWTKAISEITPRIERRTTEDDHYQVVSNWEDVFLRDVDEAAKEKRYKFWLEIVNNAGEIRKLPCTVDNARSWLKKSVVTLCQQLPNHYYVHRAYRDPPICMREVPF
jgi:hypothetical protein